MSELLLTESQATSLYGTEFAGVGVVLPNATQNNWGADRNRADSRLVDVAMLANALRVYPVEANVDAVGVRPGRCTINGVVYSFAGTDPAVDAITNNDTTYVWGQDDGGGLLEILSAIDATGWPVTAHIKLAEVTMAAGIITLITDRRAECMLGVGADSQTALQLAAYAGAITVQGTTSSPSTVTFTLKDSLGNTIAGTNIVRVRVCNQAGYSDSTNATFSPGVNTTTLETITATKDLILQSHTDGVYTVSLTNAVAESVTLRTGPPPLSGSRADHTATLDVTHAA
jgi:hypothetical protein